MMDKNEFAKKDLFARHCGMELLKQSDGYALARMRIEDFHKNGLGTVHGGAIFALADFVFAAASNTPERTVVAVNVTIAYVKAAENGVLTAEGRAITPDVRLPIYEVLVRDEAGNLIATFQGMGYKKTK